MSRSKSKGRKPDSRSRLELIRKRHRELILSRRDMFADDVDDYDPFEDLADSDELAFADTVSVGR